MILRKSFSLVSCCFSVLELRLTSSGSEVSVSEFFLPCLFPSVHVFCMVLSYFSVHVFYVQIFVCFLVSSVTQSISVSVVFPPFWSMGQCCLVFVPVKRVSLLLSQSFFLDQLRWFPSEHPVPFRTCRRLVHYC